MLFNSYTFVLLFLPATVGVFQGLRRLGWNRGAFAALTLASLAFYTWWSIWYRWEHPDDVAMLKEMVGKTRADAGLVRTAAMR
jgi:hypothetical protein